MDTLARESFVFGDSTNKGGLAVLAFLSQKAREYRRADTIALLIYNLCIGTLNLFMESAYAGYTGWQWFGIHVGYNIVKFYCAWVPGWLKRALRTWFGVRDEGGGIRHFVLRGITATIALALYQIPLYLVFASFIGVMLMHVEWSQVGIAVRYALIEHLLFAWIHGILSDRCEKAVKQHRGKEIVLDPKAASE